MEILPRQALIGIRISETNSAGWSGLPFTTTTLGSATEGPGVAVGCICRRGKKLLPKITTVSRNLGCGPEGQKFCRCSLVGSSYTRLYDTLQMASISGRSYSRAECRGNSICWYSATGGKVGKFNEGFGRCGRIGLVTVKGKFRSLPVATSTVNDRTTEATNVDLELEIFRFMQQSRKPNVFPTKDDLLSAGRTDLVLAIGVEGGWLTDGWEELETTLPGSNSATNEGSSARGRKGSSRQRSRKGLKARPLKRSSTARKSSAANSKGVVEPIHGITERVNGTDGMRDVGMAEGKDRRKNTSHMIGLRKDGAELKVFPTMERSQLPLDEGSPDLEWKFSSRRDDFQAMEDGTSSLSYTEELQLKRPQKRHQFSNLSPSSSRESLAKEAIETRISSKSLSQSSFKSDTLSETLSENILSDNVQDSRDAATGVSVVPTRKKTRRKKERRKGVDVKSPNEVNQTSDWIGQIVDERAKWVVEVRSKSVDRLSGASAFADSKSMQSRIHMLETKLVDTREALQSGREALWQMGNDNEVHQQALSELIDAEDSLEFRENAIMHARSELHTLRAQTAALEGNLNVEIMEAHRILDEKNRKIEMTRTILQHLRTARVVWPNPAREVFLTGSFDGWHNQIEMVKSSAGVFVVSLPLYPGRYEIKFIVDGSWRVDTMRPVVYVGGYENNVLTVS